jgi:hypothetical protein
MSCASRDQGAFLEKRYLPLVLDVRWSSGLLGLGRSDGVSSGV